MKKINLKKLLLTLTLLFLIQNSAITCSHTTEASCSVEELIAPCNDIPSYDTSTN
jgi:hypothetical protein